jgi:hypothetical protein
MVGLNAAIYLEKSLKFGNSQILFFYIYFQIIYILFRKAKRAEQNFLVLFRPLLFTNKRWLKSTFTPIF